MFVLSVEKTLKIKIIRAFVRYYPKIFVRLGQMVLITVFIDLTPILGLYMFGNAKQFNLMRMT